MEPVIPCDLLNYDLIEIKDKGNGYAMFTYSNQTLDGIELKILIEKGEIRYDSTYKCVHLMSYEMNLLERNLEEKIHKYKGGDLAKRDERRRKIKINFTPNSDVTIIYKEEDEDDQNIKKLTKYNKKEKISYTKMREMLDKGYDIGSGCLVNIIIKPVISKKSNYVNFDVIYCDIFRKYLPNTGKIYNKLDLLYDIKPRDKIIL